MDVHYGITVPQKHCQIDVAWRKSIRRICNIPYTTHRALLNEICGDMHLQDQLYIEFYALLISTEVCLLVTMC